MSQTHRDARSVVIGFILVGLGVTWPHAAQAGQPQMSYDPNVGHKEEPVRPPAIAATSSLRVLAPSAGVAGTAGVVTLRQVNVAPGGLNMIADAANEPSLAIDPNDTDLIAVGWRQFDTIDSDFRQAGVAYSHDGGTTWTFPGPIGSRPVPKRSGARVER